MYPYLFSSVAKELGIKDSPYMKEAIVFPYIYTNKPQSQTRAHGVFFTPTDFKVARHGWLPPSQNERTGLSNLLSKAHSNLC